MSEQWRVEDGGPAGGYRVLAGEWETLDTTGREFCEIIARCSDLDHARLIAAAPELLAACEATLAQLDYLRNLWCDEGIIRDLADQLRAAIAQARGGE